MEILHAFPENSDRHAVQTEPAVISTAAFETIDLDKLVRGEYEARLLQTGSIDCYRATSANLSPLNRASPLYRPEMDEARLRAGAPKPVWPGGAPFAACLTHDVDQVASRNPRMHARRIINYLRHLRKQRDRQVMLGLEATLVALGRSLSPFRGQDPFHAYEQWLAIEAEVGARSTFLFLPDTYARPHYTDSGYRYSHRVRFDGQVCSVAEMMREIDRRGWEVGLHASWQTYDCVGEMKRQKAQVEAAIDTEVRSVRQHKLHFDIRRTPRAQHEAGLLVDSSLGFNDNIGFRYSTCYPRFLGDWESHERLDVIELPLLIQDKCLLEIVACGSEELASEWGDRIIERVQAVGGVVTLLWHPQTICQPAYVKVYRRLLKTIRDRGAWFATMAEIARWWCRSANRELRS